MIILIHLHFSPDNDDDDDEYDNGQSLHEREIKKQQKNKSKVVYEEEDDDDDFDDTKSIVSTMSNLSSFKNGVLYVVRKVIKINSEVPKIHS